MSPTPILVGQPFTFDKVSIPVNMTLTCNCGRAFGAVGTVIEIVASAPTPCPSCGKIFAPFFDPTKGQLQMTVTTLQDEGHT